MAFLFKHSGTLTKKQLQKIKTMGTIVESLYDEQANCIWRTVLEITRATGLSRGVLSRHIRELVKQGVIKGEVRVAGDRLTMFFAATGKPYVTEGKIEDIDADVIYTNPDYPSIIYERATMKKLKGGKRKRFVRGRRRIDLEPKKLENKA